MRMKINVFGEYPSPSRPNAIENPIRMSCSFTTRRADPNRIRSGRPERTPHPASKASRRSPHEFDSFGPSPRREGGQQEMVDSRLPPAVTSPGATRPRRAHHGNDFSPSRRSTPHALEPPRRPHQHPGFPEEARSPPLWTRAGQVCALCQNVDTRRERLHAPTA